MGNQLNGGIYQVWLLPVKFSVRLEKRPVCHLPSLHYLFFQGEPAQVHGVSINDSGETSLVDEILRVFYCWKRSVELEGELLFTDEWVLFYLRVTQQSFESIASRRFWESVLWFEARFLLLQVFYVLDGYFELLLLIRIHEFYCLLVKCEIDGSKSIYNQALLE